MLTHSPSPQPARIVVHPADVDARLQELDPALTQELMLEANQRGFEARLEATLAHAPTAAGTLHWHAFVPALRLALKVQDWIIKDHKNCPLIISADRSMAIVVMTGNSETGKEFGNPTNQADKGAVLYEAVQKNILQNGDGGTQLWVLLYHVDAGVKDAREIRSELSLPSSFHKKKIIRWAERIILRSIPTDPSTRITPSLPIEPIEVVVERKTGS